MVDRDYNPFGSVRDSMDAMAKLDQARTNEALRKMAAGQSGRNENACLICGGTGITTCRYCKGKGTKGKTIVIEGISRPGAVSEDIPCAMCKGSGQEKCLSCDGTGIRR